MQILGLQELKGTSRKTGRPYDMVVLYVGEESLGVFGQRVSEVCVQRAMWDEKGFREAGPAFVGQECRVSYDRRGYLQDIDIG